jgi:hypothetical protein
MMQIGACCLHFNDEVVGNSSFLKQALPLSIEFLATPNLRTLLNTVAAATGLARRQ